MWEGRSVRVYWVRVCEGEWAGVVVASCLDSRLVQTK